MLSWYIWAHVLTSIVPSQNKYNPEQSTAAGMPWHSAQNKGILIYLLWSQRNKTPYNTTKFSCLFFAILTHIDIQLLCSSDSNRSVLTIKKQKSRAKLHCITALHKLCDDISWTEKYCFHFVQCQKCLPRCRGFHQTRWGIYIWRVLHLFPPPLIPLRSTLTEDLHKDTSSQLFKSILRYCPKGHWAILCRHILKVVWKLFSFSFRLFCIISIL